MTPETLARLFDPRSALADPFVRGCVIIMPLVLVIAFLISWGLLRLKWIGDERYRELALRIRSWAYIIPAIAIPILLGAFWTMLGLLGLAIFCYREFARITGQFRNYRVSAWTVFGILLLFFAALDNWHGLYTALHALGVVLIAGAGIYADQPKGYLQRVALGVFCFFIFGAGFSHIAFLGNDADYRALILLLILAVELNDVFGYLAGNLVTRANILGKSKLCPNTSPGKTWGGSIGALLGTSILVWAIGTNMRALDSLSHFHLLTLGLVISVSGQLGDLIMSSVKRDLNIKDTGTVIPGHGGLLDRFDSLLVAGPAFFHFINYFRGIGIDQTTRIISGVGS